MIREPENMTAIPDAITFNQASLLPQALAVVTAWFSFFTCGVSHDTLFNPADKQGILIWGVGGSVGSVALQIAKSVGFYVYATACQPKTSCLSPRLGAGAGNNQII